MARQTASKISPWPNILSMLRVMVAIPLFLAIRSESFVLLGILAAIALMSDYFDGYLARKLNSISESGKILDPLADKICIASVAVAGVIYGDLPLVLCLIIVGRDLLIVAVGMVIIKKKKVIPTSNIWGKITVSVLALALIIYIFKLTALYSAAFWVAIFFSILSLTSYFFKRH